VRSDRRTTIRGKGWSGPLHSCRRRDPHHKHSAPADLAGLHPLLRTGALLRQSVLRGGTPRVFAFPLGCFNADLFLVAVLALQGHASVRCLQIQRIFGIRGEPCRV
jgi:hypothetical protein